ncbi:MAG: flagellar hook-basal body complex protein FliE, partial [Eubacteriales bacterium]|nr:flagellar hook-basal body complex protein FliE [Eubacteriales bacterium]
TSAVNSLGSDYVSKVTEAMKQAVSVDNGIEKNGDSFDSVYNAVSGLLGSTNAYIQNAQKAEVDFALGNLTNTHELGAAQQKANLALQYTVSIRDKALEAYNTIMNMQI